MLRAPGCGVNTDSLTLADLWWRGVSFVELGALWKLEERSLTVASQFRFAGSVWVWYGSVWCGRIDLGSRNAP